MGSQDDGSVRFPGAVRHPRFRGSVGGKQCPCHQASGTQRLLGVKVCCFVLAMCHTLGVRMRRCLLSPSTGRKLGLREHALVAIWDSGPGFSRPHPRSLS